MYSLPGAVAIALKQRVALSRLFSHRIQPTPFNGLPFLVSKSDAVQKIREEPSGYLQHCSALLSKNGSTNATNDVLLKSCFLPFYSVDAPRVKCKYVVEYPTYHTSERLVWIATGNGHGFFCPTTVTSTHWHKRHCEQEVSYSYGDTVETQIYARFDYPREVVEKIFATKEVKDIQLLNSDVGERDYHTVLPIEMNTTMAFSIILKRLTQLETQRLQQSIDLEFPNSRRRVVDVTLDLKQFQIQWIVYYMPCYVLDKPTPETHLTTFVNGHSGEMSENQRLVTPFINGVAGALLGVFVTASSAIPGSLTLPILLPAAIFPGAMFVLFTHLQHKWLSYSIRKQLEWNREKNTSSSDMCNIVLSSQFADLLNLPQNTAVSRTQVEEAYYNEVKKHLHSTSDSTSSMEARAQQLTSEYGKFITFLEQTVEFKASLLPNQQQQ
jgi:hypothetical protein